MAIPTSARASAQGIWRPAGYRPRRASRMDDRQMAAAVTGAVADADLFGLPGAGGTARQVSPAGGKALAARVPVCPRPMT